MARPDLATIEARVQADLEARLPGTNPRLRRSLLRALGRVMAGSAHGLHGYLDFISKQVIPDTATNEFLVHWAHIWGVDRALGAKATGQVTITGETGASVPIGAEVQTQEGVAFLVTTGVTIGVSEEAEITVEAKDVGADGNLQSGTVLYFISPQPGVDANASSGSLTGGADLDDDEDLRARLLRRIQRPPQGGAAHDYLAWALEVPGVDRVWVYPLYQGLGTVGITFTVEGNDPIPNAGKLEEVFDYIDERRPVTAAVTVFAPVSTPRNFTIAVEPDLLSVRNAVEAELRDLMSTAQPDSTLYLTHIHEAISRAPGEVNHTLVSPAADVVYDKTQLPVFGAITWV